MKVLQSVDTALVQFNGSEITDVRPLPESEYDKSEVGPMFEVDLKGHGPVHVFADEIKEV